MHAETTHTVRIAPLEAPHAEATFTATRTTAPPSAPARAVEAIDALDARTRALAERCADRLDVAGAICGLEQLRIAHGALVARRIATELTTQLRNDPRTRAVIETELKLALDAEIAEQCATPHVARNGLVLAIHLPITDDVTLETDVSIDPACEPFDGADAACALKRATEAIDTAARRLAREIDPGAGATAVPALRIAGRNALLARIAAHREHHRATAPNETIVEWTRGTITAAVRTAIDDALHTAPGNSAK